MKLCSEDEMMLMLMMRIESGIGHIHFIPFQSRSSAVRCGRYMFSHCMNPDGLCIQLQQCPVVELQAHTRHMAVLTRSESRETAGLSFSPCSDQRASCSIEGVSFAMRHPFAGPRRWLGGSRA